jgi:Protein of unknown function (DUF998)
MPILDVLITAWLGALDPGYSHVRQYISELGEAGRPHAWMFSAWCIAYSIPFAAFAIALFRGLDGRTGSWLGPGALLVVAASSVVSGVFPCDPGCAMRSFSARVHLWAGEIAMAGIVLAPFLTWTVMRENELWRGYGAFTLATGVLLAGAGGWMAVCHYADLPRSACAVGAAQRLFLGILYVWVEVVAVRLWRFAAR